MFKLRHHLLQNLKKGSKNSKGSFGQGKKDFDSDLNTKILDFMKIDLHNESEACSELNQHQLVDYLKSIQISRTDYSIKGNKVVQISDKEHMIHDLYEVLSKMHDG